MGLQLFLIGLLLIGMKVKADSLDECTQMVIHNGYEPVLNMNDQQQFRSFCVNMTNYFSCIDGVMIQESGYNMKQAAKLLKFHPIGKALQMLVNVKELIMEICTEGSDLNTGYVANLECFQNATRELGERCEEHARNASEIFSEIQENRSMRRQTDEECVTAAYQMGCSGANIYQRCGEEGFNTFKNILKKIGLFRSGLCSPAVMRVIKTSLMDRMDMSEVNKSLYGVILNLRRRRR